MQMTQEDLDEWCDALESGKWPQGKCYLNKDGNYCCLGVKAELDVERLGLKREIVHGVVDYNMNPTMWPVTMEMRYGCTKNGGNLAIPWEKLSWWTRWTLRGKKERASWKRNGVGLAQLNDAGVSFKAIAKLLRKHVTVINNYTERKVVRQGLA